MKNFKFYVTTALISITVMSCEKDNLLNDNSISSTIDKVPIYEPDTYYFVGNDSVKGSEMDSYMSAYNKKFLEENTYLVGRSEFDGSYARDAVAPSTDLVSSDFHKKYPELEFDQVGFDFPVAFGGVRGWLISGDYNTRLFNRININTPTYNAPYGTASNSRKVVGIGHQKAWYMLRTNGDIGSLPAKEIYDDESNRPSSPLYWLNEVSYNYEQIDLNGNKDGLNLEDTGWNFVGSSDILPNPFSYDVTAYKRAKTLAKADPFYVDTQSKTTVTTNTQNTDTSISYDWGVVFLNGLSSNLSISSSSSTTQSASTTVSHSQGMDQTKIIKPGQECRYKLYRHSVTSGYKNKINSILNGPLLGARYSGNPQIYQDAPLDCKILLEPEDVDGVENTIALNTTSYNYHVEFICRRISDKVVVSHPSSSFVKWDN